ncbi:hypothetical protein [Niallia taxi]|uniref:hypothetical protein n=1 Tax=Niallia taxi TaxID=2499688 RepID=UPI0015F4609D|nr:hypothetical protein [Niallia taxi]
MNFEKWYEGRKYTIYYFGKNQYGDVQLLVLDDERMIDHSEMVYQKLEDYFKNTHLPNIEFIEDLTNEDFF